MFNFDLNALQVARLKQNYIQFPAAYMQPPIKLDFWTAEYLRTGVCVRNSIMVTTKTSFSVIMAILVDHTR